MMTKDMKQGVWVLTAEYNDYNQHGEYLSCVWSDKPTLEQLVSLFKYDSGQPANVMGALEFLLHIQNGGGRRGNEDSWYNLAFVEFGKRVGA